MCECANVVGVHECVYREFGDILHEEVVGGLPPVVHQSRDNVNCERSRGCLGKVQVQRP